MMDSMIYKEFIGYLQANKQEVKLSANTDFEEYMHNESFLPNAIATFGSGYLIKFINGSLNDSRYSVDFFYKNTTEVLINGLYHDILIFYFDFTIPKPIRVLEMVDKFKKELNVKEVIEGDETLTFSLELNEGIPVYTIDRIVQAINKELSPYVKAVATDLGINDFTAEFKISAI